MTSNYTTIRITNETKVVLDFLKDHPRQTYDELLTQMFEVLKLDG